jgi:hypothetical protein
MSKSRLLAEKRHDIRRMKVELANPFDGGQVFLVVVVTFALRDVGHGFCSSEGLSFSIASASVVNQR